MEAGAGRIELHFDGLAAREASGEAITTCVRRIAEAGPALRAIVERAASGETLDEDEARRLLRSLFILGAARDEATCPILMRLLRRPDDEVEHLLGGALEVGLPNILSGTFDGDADALLALAADPSCLEAVRCSAMEAATFLAFDGRVPRERMRALLSDFTKAKPDKGDLVWAVWSSAVAKLGYRDLAPFVEAAIADGRISKGGIRKRQFDNELAAAEADPADASRFAEASYIEDVTEAILRVDGSSIADGEHHRAPLSAAAVPIAMHLSKLGTALRLPDASLEACVARFDEAGPGLRALLDRAAAGRHLAEDEELRLIRGLYVLAAARDTTACASLLRLLRRPLEETDALLGDVVSQSLPRLLISVFDGEVEPLLDVVADRKLDEVLRGATLDATAYLAWEGRIDRERLAAFLVRFHEKRLAQEGDYVWCAWLTTIAYLDLRDLVPQAEAAWKAGLVDESFIEWDEFKMDLARAHTAWGDVGRFARSNLGYADDIVAELEWTRHWGDEDRAGVTDAWQPSSPATPAVNPMKNVGRNDPCPCGSGRKYKKCCLVQ